MGGNINNSVNTVLNKHNSVLQMYVKTRSINYDFHKGLNYQKKSVIPNTKMFFRQKKIEPNKENIALNEDLAIITKITTTPCYLFLMTRWVRG